ncbi:MAG: dockerin type I domain-containing protein, partial [Chloroflexota bacterium]|nr:dockerin type I domain-containing protein [Chloroflexota bacterium]
MAYADTVPDSCYGDVDGDGDIDLMDYSRLQLIRFGQQAFTAAADVNVDGSLTILDYSRLQLIRFGQQTRVEKHSASYNSSGSGTAKSKALSAVPPANDFDDLAETGWTEATPPQYSNIATEDGNVWTIAGTSYAALQYRFTIDEAVNASDITAIGITLNGSAQTNGDELQFWVWNDTGATWAQVGANINMTTSNEAYTAWSVNWGKVFDDYVDGNNYMYILANLATDGEDLNVDYIELTVATTTPSDPIGSTLTTSSTAGGFVPTPGEPGP